MEQTKIQIGILPNQFLKRNGTFDKKEAIKLSGKIAGICYDKEGFTHVEQEDEEKTMRRVKMTLYNGHHSVYDHILINLNIQNLPKILAMILNNEHQYTTSEKSARYTPIVQNATITQKEEQLYNKWIKIFNEKIKSQYGNIYNDNKIQKLAQENARYLVTVFMPTQMIYSVSLRQINYIASWLEEYIKNCDKNSEFNQKLVIAIEELLNELYKLNVLEEGLMMNDKHRNISLFGQNLQTKQNYFGDVYSCTYKASFAYLAQAQRHRTLDYQMEMNNDKEYFIPPIIADDQMLVDQWLEDMQTVKNTNPQGELITINEIGKYDDFILKCKERLCSAAQLEIMLKTKDILTQYQNSLNEQNNPLASDIQKYTYGARCTFPDFDCLSDCNFKEGKTLVRKI